MQILLLQIYTVSLITPNKGPNNFLELTGMDCSILIKPSWWTIAEI
jgi:hypothetical protein